MEILTIDSQKDRYIISIEKEAFDKDFLLDILEKLKAEALAKKMNIGDDISELANEIKRDWWERNKGKFIRIDP